MVTRWLAEPKLRQELANIVRGDRKLGNSVVTSANPTPTAMFLAVSGYIR